MEITGAIGQQVEEILVAGSEFLEEAFPRQGMGVLGYEKDVVAGKVYKVMLQGGKGENPQSNNPSSSTGRKRVFKRGNDNYYGA